MVMTLLALIAVAFPALALSRAPSLGRSAWTPDDSPRGDMPGPKTKQGSWQHPCVHHEYILVNDERADMRRTGNAFRRYFLSVLAVPLGLTTRARAAAPAAFFDPKKKGIAERIAFCGRS
jgi:hypothetical protein